MIAVFIVLVLFLGAIVGMVRGDTTAAVTIPGEANIRSGAGTTFSVIRVAHKGEEIRGCRFLQRHFGTDLVQDTRGNLVRIRGRLARDLCSGHYVASQLGRLETRASKGGTDCICPVLFDSLRCRRGRWHVTAKWCGDSLRAPDDYEVTYVLAYSVRIQRRWRQDLV